MASKLIKVLYEDDIVIIFDKPSGMLTIPTPKGETNTLIDLVNVSVGKQGPRLHPCHRLDRDTSGAIMFANGKANQQIMMKAFQEHQVAKKYIAFVRGQIRPADGEINRPIADFHQKKFQKSSPAKPAVTRYKTLEVRKQFSVVEAEPVTGRTNQIRIHFAKIGHPLLGERIYAFGKDFPIKFRRVALHARELSWKHPLSRKLIHIICEIPQDMTEFLSKNY